MEQKPFFFLYVVLTLSYCLKKMYNIVIESRYLKVKNQQTPLVWYVLMKYVLILYKFSFIFPFNAIINDFIVKFWYNFMVELRPLETGLLIIKVR